MKNHDARTLRSKSGVDWSAAAPTMLKVQIHANEILTSFVSRSARANGIERMRSFCIDLGVSLPKLKLGDRAEVLKFADLVGASRDQMLHAAVERDNRTRIRVGHEWFDNSRLSRMHLRFCPECVATDLVRDSFSGPYYRTYWLLPQIVTCAKHRKHIVEAEQPQRLETNSQDFCAIIDQLRKQAPALLYPAANRDPTHFEVYATKRLCGEMSEKPNLDGLPLETIIVMSEVVGVAVAHLGASKRNLSSEQMVEVREVGFAAIEKGRRGFQESLDRVTALAPAGSCSPHGLYGALYTALDRTRSQGSYDVFRSALVEHAAMSGRIAPGTSLFGARSTTAASRVRSVANEAGVAIDRVKRVLKAKGLTAPAGAAGLLDPTVAAAAKEHFADVWSFKDAREFLGCNLRTFSSLLEAGIIPRPPTSFPQGFVSRQAAMSLAIRLAESRTVDVGSHLVDISVARAGAKSSIAEIVRYVLNGRLSSVAIEGNRPILAALRVSIEEVRQAHLPDGHVTAEAARELLRLNTTGFADLLANGLIETTSLEHPRADWHAVPLAEVDRFRATFISMQECAEKLKVSKNAMASIARRAGVPPAYPADVVGQQIFLRTNLGTILAGSR
ncbi:TniQ family protein [Rhizobium sp. 2MFCol3.1]|uniref:TniQ family protein n=1 Tax=Rhizobium sp. 2MFCol3.1 TaxID=1246459 RepID=UPI000360944C|nr:TniQ family protein [Rhizobium sp. 2MFCol3.1]